MPSRSEKGPRDKGFSRFIFFLPRELRTEKERIININGYFAVWLIFENIPQYGEYYIM